MPFVILFVRRWLLGALVLPLVAKLLTAVARRVEASRGPGPLTSLLTSASRLVSSSREESGESRRRGLLRRRAR